MSPENDTIHFTIGRVEFRLQNGIIAADPEMAARQKTVLDVAELLTVEYKRQEGTHLSAGFKLQAAIGAIGLDYKVTKVISDSR